MVSQDCEPRDNSCWVHLSSSRDAGHALQSVNSAYQLREFMERLALQFMPLDACARERSLTFDAQCGYVRSECVQRNPLGRACCTAQAERDERSVNRES